MRRAPRAARYRPRARRASGSRGARRTDLGGNAPRLDDPEHLAFVHEQVIGQAVGGRQPLPIDRVEDRERAPRLPFAPRDRGRREVRPEMVVSRMANERRGLRRLGDLPLEIQLRQLPQSHRVTGCARALDLRELAKATVDLGERGSAVLGADRCLEGED